MSWWKNHKAYRILAIQEKHTYPTMDWKQVYSQTSELFNRFAAAGAPSMPVRDWPAVVTWSGKEWPGLYHDQVLMGNTLSSLQLYTFDLKQSRKLKWRSIKDKVYSIILAVFVLIDKLQ